MGRQLFNCRPKPGSVPALNGQGDVAVADLACPSCLAATDLNDPGDVVGAGLFSCRRMTRTDLGDTRDIVVSVLVGSG